MILKLKRTPGIYMVGFMGSGKSTVGRTVARQLGWRFADLDEDVEHRERMTIPEIFDQRGEEEFRRVEAECLQQRVHEIARGVPWVIAVGGGCFTTPGNLDLIQNHGVSIWLDATLDVIRHRLAHSTHRPLARDPQQMEALFWKRRTHYERADYRIEIATDDSAAAAHAVLQLPLF